MAPPVKIVTDSSAYLAPETVAKYDIRVVPLKVAFGGDVYTEGVDITNDDFYQRVGRTGVFPTTSQPSAGDFLQVYEELARQGHPILSLHISARLSGTVNSAIAARRELARSQIEIMGSSSLALGMLVAPAAEAAEKGLTLSQVRAYAEELNASLKAIGMFNTLEYLRKGGRIGAARALAGTLLGIKPVLTFQDGEVKVLAKPRTAASATERILDFISKRIERGTSLHGWIAHTHVFKTALALEERLRERFDWAELRLFELGPVFGTHMGPGFVGVSFYNDKA